MPRKACLRPSLALLLGLISLTCRAAAPATPASVPTLPPGDRFLFLVDTSSGMSRLGHASRQAVFHIIWTGLNGHFRAGDTLGVWTFSDAPHPGKLPMQTWETNALEVASRIGRFLRDQPYGKRANLGAAMEKALLVVGRVQDVTVFVVSDGASPMAHTPFDDAINAVFKERSPVARQQKRPLITTLVARGGRFVRWSVTWPEEDIPMPERASRPLVEPTPRNAVAAMPVVPEARPPRPAIIITNSRPRSLAETTFSAPSEVPQTSETRTVTATNSPSEPAPAQVVASQAPDLPEGAVNTSLTVTPPRVLVQTAAPAVTLRLKDKAVVVTPPALPTNSPIEPVQSTMPINGVAKLPGQGLAAMPVAARESGSNTPVVPEPLLAVTPTRARPVTLHPLWLFGLGLVLFLAALALTVIYVRRLRLPPQPSFITRSMHVSGPSATSDRAGAVPPGDDPSS